MADPVTPTRSELIKLKQKIALSQRGHKLLKMKRDGLMYELFQVLPKVRTIRANLVKGYRSGMNKIHTAELQTTFKRILEEVEKTKRRVNALEFKVIPELIEVRNFIALRLEEIERENIFRLKRVKAKAGAPETTPDRSGNGYEASRAPD